MGKIMSFTPPPLMLFILVLTMTVVPRADAQEQSDQEEPPQSTTNPKPVTTADPAIPLDYLDLRLDPLTRDEVEVEMFAWRDLVKGVATQIAEEEIQTREQNAAIAGKAGQEGNIADVKAEKQRLLTDLTALREKNSALLERLDVVIRAFEEKGGDAEEIKQYAQAVSGIKVEVDDSSAAWSAVTGWIVSKEGGIKVGLKIAQFLGIMLVFWGLAALVGALILRMTSRASQMSALLKSFLNTVIKRTIIFVGFLVALSTLGVEIGAMLALLGGGAFILGFALQDTLGNFASGMMLLVYRPFDEGDIVEVGGVLGTVNRVSLVNTTIRTFDNKIVLVPNKQVWGEVIINATASSIRRVDMVFGISYSDDVDQAQQLLAEIVGAHELVRNDPAPVIELNTLGESSVDFICRPWCKTDDYWRVYWDITKQVKKSFEQAGISIPFPQRDVHFIQHNDADPLRESDESSNATSSSVAQHDKVSKG